MSIKFNIHEIGNPRDLEAPKKFYARPIHSGERSLEDLAIDISHASSINESDVYAVLQSLVREIPRNIALGYIVRLGALGSFRLTSKSTGSDLESDVSSSNIINVRVLFHAGKRVRDLMRDLTFRKNS